MKAVILVAGMGTRLKPLTNNVPKCLTEVNGKSILVNMLENLAKNNIEESILVIGYLGNKIKERIGDMFGSMKIKYVENDIYDKTNTSYSLYLALKNMDISDSILILEGDVFFEEKLLTEFLSQNFENSAIVQKYNPSLDGSFVAISNNLITDWVHKKVRPQNFVVEDKFKN